MHTVTGTADHSPAVAGFSLPALACLGVSILVAAAASTRHTSLCAPERTQQRIGELAEGTFRARYQFRRAHVWQLMQEFGLMDGAGQPLLLRVGRHKNQLIWADTALLIVLLRLAHANCWDDLAPEFGCSRALLSASFIHLIDYPHDRFASHLNDLSTWQADFPSFAAHTRARGALFANTIGFVDGHFQPVSRQGGQQNVGHSVAQQDLYSGYYKTHGLKYVCVVLPNGVLLAHGAWRGKEHDNTTLHESKVVLPIASARICCGMCWAQLTCCWYAGHN
jgi:hypothetical protein